MEHKSERDAVVELVNKLFVYTDYRYCEKLAREVFSETILFDMSGQGPGQARTMTATEICDMWHKGFAGIDHVHHQAGNFIVNFNNEGVEADIFCYAIAVHYKNSANNGKTREFVGSYDLHARLTDLGWRLDSFRYNLKYISGNKDLT